MFGVNIPATIMMLLIVAYKGITEFIKENYISIMLFSSALLLIIGGILLIVCAIQ